MRRCRTFTVPALMVAALCIVSDRSVSQSRGTAITSRDGSEMVRIPAGTFVMGSTAASLPQTAEWMRRLYPQRQDLTERSFEDETPPHPVDLDAFYIDRYEVTNEQYRRFVQATGHREPQGMAIVQVNGEFVTQPSFRPWADPHFSGAKQPVVCVTLEDAKAYAAWAGKRLPTEAEWEKAARGGLAGKEFTWGDHWPPPSNAGNFAEEAFKRVFTASRFPAFAGYDDAVAYTAPVGSFTPNGYGLFDMAGNAAEWVEDLYAKDYYGTSPRKDPHGPESGEKGITRGGSWFYKWAYVVRVAKRESGPRSWRGFDVGFRCAMDAKALPKQ